MKKLIILCAALFVATTFVRAAEELKLRDITSGYFSTEYLSAVTPLNDGESYAQISSDGKKVIAYSYKTGKQTDVLFDIDNTHGEPVSKFDNYILSPDGTKMLIQTQTEPIYRHSFKAVFYLYNIKSHKLEKLSDYGKQQSPVWSPDGTQVAFVRDNNIYLVKLLYDNAESQITKDGKFNEVINGIPDWVNEEEFGWSTALTFNADGSMLCWLRYDESKVKTYALQMFKGMKPERAEWATYPGEYSYKYPKAGEQNASMSAWSFDIKSRQTRKIDLPLKDDGYIPRIKATNDPEKIIIYTMNRHQDELCLYAANPRTTVCQQIVKESVPKYIKEEVLGGIKIYDEHILMPSDRDGNMHLYLYSINGVQQRQITSGKFDVTEIYGYDEATGNTYYQADMGSPMNREVYVTNAKGKTERLTKRDGWNSAIFSKGFKYFVNTWSDANTPYQFATYDNNGKVLAELISNDELKQKLTRFNLPQKEMFSFQTSEGVTLNGVMIKPVDFSPSKKYPVVMWQYSGPGSQQVVNSWRIGSMGQGALYDSYLTQKGFIVVCVDGRGTGGRGTDFEKCTYQKLGQLESKDQAEAALYLSKLPYVDGSRIGIWGWSYGGFNTLMSMSEGRGAFKAGVAVAPPTSYRYYDTIYTERFMRTPQENPDGYNDNPITRADKMSGALLICHGLADDNVHPQNTFEYTEALVQADKDFTMNIYTNRNHSIYGGNTRLHLLRQIAQFFEDKLK